MVNCCPIRPPSHGKCLMNLKVVTNMLASSNELLWHVVLVDQVLKVIYLIRNKWQDCHTLCKYMLNPPDLFQRQEEKYFDSAVHQIGGVLLFWASFHHPLYDQFYLCNRIFAICSLFLSIFSFSKSPPRHRSCSRMDPSHPEIMDVITITFPTNIVVMIGIGTWKRTCPSWTMYKRSGSDAYALLARSSIGSTCP